MSQLLAESMVLGIGGCIAGLVVAWAGLRILAAGAPQDFYQLAGVTIDPSDLTTFVAAPVVLVTVALIACAVPAWRASGLDPAIVLRYD